MKQRLLQKMIEQRVLETADYIINTNCTLRQAASHFGYSKSTVDIDVNDRLIFLDNGRYQKVRKVLEINKAERHLRGGMQTAKMRKGS